MILNDNIFYTYFDFSSEIWGVVYKCSKGHYHIGINKNLAKNIQKQVLKHELTHINKHLPNKPYIIGLDMHHSDFEKGTDAQAQKLFSGQK